MLLIKQRRITLKAHDATRVHHISALSTKKYTPFSNPFCVGDLRLAGLDQANMEMPFS